MVQWICGMTCTSPAAAIPGQHCLDCSGLCVVGINRRGPNGLMEVTCTWPTCQAAADPVYTALQFILHCSSYTVYKINK